MADLPEGWTNVSDDPRLKDIHQRESGNKNLPPQANVNYRLQGPLHSSASGVDQMQPGTYRDWSRQFGIGKQYSEAYQAPPNTQDALALMAYQKWGPNASNTWAASGPYKDLRQQNQQQQQQPTLPKGWKQAAPPSASSFPKGWSAAKKPPEFTGPLHDQNLGKLPPPQAPWRVDPKFEGPRSNVRAGIEDPSITAHQPDQGISAKVAGAVQWIKKNYPDLQLADMMGDLTKWAAGKGQDALESAFTKAGVPNAGRAARDLTQYAVEFAPFQGGLGIKGFKPPGVSGAAEAGGKAIGEPGTGVPRIPGEADLYPGGLRVAVRMPDGEVRIGKPGQLHSDLLSESEMDRIRMDDQGFADSKGRFLTRQQGHDVIAQENTSAATAPDRGFASVGAAATPLHEIAADNVRRWEAEQKANDPGFLGKLKDAGKTLQLWAAPEKSALGQETHGVIRARLGENARMAEQEQHAFQKFNNFVGSLETTQQLELIKWAQSPGTRGRAGPLNMSPEAQGVLKTFGKAMNRYETAIRGLDKTAEMEFRNNYVSQLWKTKNRTNARWQESGAKQGSGYFTKKHFYEDYEEGIRNGEVPTTTNLLEIGSLYMENASRFLARNEVFDDLQGQGHVKYFSDADPDKPEGWVPLSGGEKVAPIKGQGGMIIRPYAPPEVAQVYNRFVSRPISGPVGGVFGMMTRAANLSTSFKLALNARHAFLTAAESIGSGLADAIDKGVSGHPVKGLIAAAKAPFKPITSVARGRQVQNTWLTGEGNAEMMRIVQAMQDANYSPTGVKGRVADEYRLSRMPGVMESFGKGLLKGQMQAHMMGLKGGAWSGLREVWTLTGRALQTLSEPIFRYYVPMVKNGMAADMLSTWLEARPQATRTEFAAYARQVSDSIDNRFGEVNHDNIVWNQATKQGAQAAALSFSYVYGNFIRLGLGTAADLAKFAAGKGPWTHRMSYAVALPVAASLIGNTIQAVMVGINQKKISKDQLPVNWSDWWGLSPRTGNIDPVTGQPDRIGVPSVMNQWVHFFADPKTELYNKANQLWKTAYEIVVNSDFKRDPIYDEYDPTIRAMTDKLKYAASQAFTPIGIQQVEFGRGVAGMIGFPQASKSARDPEGMEQGKQYGFAERMWNKHRHDINQDRNDRGLPNATFGQKEKRGWIDEWIASHHYKGAQ
jgi:hypothetical protein